MSYRIMFTGHREIPEGQYDLVWDAIVAKVTAIRDAHPDEEVTALVGMAKGADTLAGLVCVTLDVPFTACVPHRDYAKHYNLDMSVYMFLLRRAAMVQYINDAPKFDWRSNFARNAYMVQWCAECIAITHLNKDPENLDVSAAKYLKGGTADAIKKALEKGKPVHYIHFDK